MILRGTTNRDVEWMPVYGTAPLQNRNRHHGDQMPGVSIGSVIPPKEGKGCAPPLYHEPIFIDLVSGMYYAL